MQSMTNVDELTVFYIQQQIAEGNKTRALQLAKEYTVQNLYDPSGWLVLGTLHKENGELLQTLDCWHKAYMLNNQSSESGVFLLSAINEYEGLSSSLAQTLLDKLYINPDELIFNDKSDFQEIFQCLSNRGMVVIRNILNNRHVLEKWNAIFNYNLKLLNYNLEENHAVPFLYIAQQENEEEFYRRYQNGAKGADLWSAKNYTQSISTQIITSLNLIMENTILPSLIKQFLKKDYKLHLDYSAARSVYGNGEFYLGGPHQDGRLQNRQDMFITCWIPFVSCGGKRSPSIAVVPFKCNHFYPTDPHKNIGPEVPEELYFKPEFEPGDLLIQTTHSIHRSYITSEMHGTRTSIDVRFF